MAEPVRIDKWLWAARFFKTRGLAAEAIKGGRVHLDGKPVKPARDVQVGDRLEITRGQTRMTVDVTGISPRRGSASEAALLYSETEDSRRERERFAEQRRLSQPPGAGLAGRPTKRDRRLYDRARGRQG